MSRAEDHIESLFVLPGSVVHVRSLLVGCLVRSIPITSETFPVVLNDSLFRFFPLYSFVIFCCGVDESRSVMSSVCLGSARTTEVSRY